MKETFLIRMFDLNIFYHKFTSCLICWTRSNVPIEIPSFTDFGLLLSNNKPFVFVNKPIANILFPIQAQQQNVRLILDNGRQDFSKEKGVLTVNFI